MFIQRINYVAVVTCVVFQFVFGLFWYSPWAFNDAWFVFADHNHDAFDAYGIDPYLFFIGALFATTYGLAWLIMKTHSTNAKGGAKIGFMMWLLFIAPAVFTGNAFKGYSIQLSLIESGVYFINLLVSGMLIASWKRSQRQRL